MNHLYNPAELRRLREAAMLTTRGAAAASGIAAASINRIERGHVRYVRTANLERLYQLYDRRIAALRERNERLQFASAPASELKKLIDDQTLWSQPT